MSYKREIPLVLTSLIAIVAIMEFFLSLPFIPSAATFFNQSGVIITAFFLGLGFINMMMMHAKKIQKQSSGWLYSAWLILIAAIMVITGLIPPLGANPTHNLIYRIFFLIPQPAFLSLLAFMMVSIAFRAFRARTWESGVLIFWAFAQMMRNAPIGQAVVPWLAALGDWNSQTLSTAGYRTLGIAGALGVIAVGVRVMLGKERGYLGIGEEEQ